MDKITIVLDENQALKSLAYDIEIKLYRGGSDDQFVPTSVLLTVKSPGGTVQVEDVAPDVSIAGTITYELATTYTGTLWEKAILELSYDDENGDAQKETLFFDVVRSRLKNTVIDVDLSNYEPDLGSHLWDSQDDYAEQIQAAFQELWDGVQNKGKRPALLIDGGQVHQLIIYKALSIICFAFAKDVETDVWWFKYQKWEDKYNTEFSKRVVNYDADESGTIEEDEKKEGLSKIQFQR